MGVVADEVSVDGEFSIELEANELTEFFRLGFVAGSSQRHHRPFFKSFEPQMLGDSGIEHAEGIEDLSLRYSLKAISDANVGRLSRFVAVTIHHQYGGLLEGRNEERGRMYRDGALGLSSAACF